MRRERQIRTLRSTSIAGAGHDITALIGAGAYTRAIEFLRPFLFELP